MKKRLLRMLLVCCGAACLLGMTALAAEVTHPVTDGSIYFDTDTGTVTDYDGEVTEVEIPAEIEGVTVAAIDEYAFSGCESLTSVTIPDGVTSIGGLAFGYCSSLTEIVVAQENGNYCSEDGVLFDKNRSTLIQYPIGSEADRYTVPDGVETIGAAAFNGCGSLTEIVLPESLTAIGQRAFGSCTGLTGLFLPAGVTFIGEKAFAYCEALTRIDVDPGNAGYRSVYGVVFSKDMTTLVLYPAGKADEAYVIPSGVETIGADAFSACYALACVTIPDSVTRVENNAFNATGLTDVYYTGAEEQWAAVEIGEAFNTALTEATVRYESAEPLVQCPDVQVTGSAGEEGEPALQVSLQVMEIDQDVVIYYAVYDAAGWMQSIGVTTIRASDDTRAVELELALKEGADHVRLFLTDEAFAPLEALTRLYLQ